MNDRIGFMLSPRVIQTVRHGQRINPADFRRDSRRMAR